MNAPAVRDCDAACLKRRWKKEAPPELIDQEDQGQGDAGIASSGSGEWWARVKRLVRSKPPAPRSERDDVSRQQSQQADCDSAQAKTTK